MLLSTFGQFHNCISPHHLFSLGRSALLSRFVLWLWWSWERKQDTPLKKKKSVSGGRCQLCMEIVVFGPNPGIRCSREESFLGPRQSTIVTWELCVHAWACVLMHACMHSWVRLSSPAFLPPLQHLRLRPSTSLFEYPVLHADGVIKACPFPGWIAQKDEGERFWEMYRGIIRWERKKRRRRAVERKNEKSQKQVGRLGQKG